MSGRRFTVLPTIRWWQVAIAQKFVTEAVIVTVPDTTGTIGETATYA